DCALAVIAIDLPQSGVESLRLIAAGGDLEALGCTCHHVSSSLLFRLTPRLEDGTDMTTEADDPPRKTSHPMAQVPRFPTSITPLGTGVRYIRVCRVSLRRLGRRQPQLPGEAEAITHPPEWPESVVVERHVHSPLHAQRGEQAFEV